jgi:hypothetical protein
MQVVGFASRTRPQNRSAPSQSEPKITSNPQVKQRVHIAIKYVVQLT